MLPDGSGEADLDTKSLATLSSSACEIYNIRRLSVANVVGVSTCNGFAAGASTRRSSQISSRLAIFAVVPTAVFAPPTHYVQLAPS